MPSLWLVQAGSDLVGRFNSSGSLITTFDAGANEQKSIGHDGDGSLWMGEGFESRYDEWDQSGNQQFNPISGTKKAICADATNCIWVAKPDSVLQRFTQATNAEVSFTVDVDGIVKDSSGSFIGGRVFEDSLYIFDETGSIARTFQASQLAFPNEVYIGIDSSESLWIATEDNDTIYEIDQTGTTVTCFSSGGYGGGDLAGGGVTTTDEPLQAAAQPASIWASDPLNNNFALYNQNGSVIKSFFIGGPEGIALATDDCLWTTRRNGRIFEYTQNGSNTASFTPCIATSGIVLDSNDCIWAIVQSFTGSFVQYDRVGNKTSVIPSVSGRPFRGLALDGDGSFISIDAFESIITVNKSGVTGSTISVAPNIEGIGIDDSESLYFGTGPNSTIIKTDLSGSVIYSFRGGPQADFPYGITTTDQPLGTAQQATTSIWNVDTNDVVYGIDRTGAIATSFTFTGARGIGIDTTDSLWMTDDTGTPHIVEKTDQSGTPITSFIAPSSVEDISVDLGDSVLLTDDNDNNIKFSDQTGSIAKSVSSPSNAPKGAVLDSSDSIWVADAANSVYQVDQNGNQQNQLAVGTTSLRGIGIDASQCLFVAESGDSIVTINQNGTEQSTIATPGTEPFGVAHVNEPQGTIQRAFNPSDWDHFKEITLDSSQVPSDQTDFPVLINFTDSDIQAAAQSSGDDIVFSEDQSTVMDFELEKYDSSTGEIWAWVRMPTLTSASDDTIYIYYGNSGAVSRENPSGVWDAEYEHVYHFDEASGSTAFDSTGNSNDGTIGSNVTLGGSGPNGSDAFDFSGTDTDFVDTGIRPQDVETNGITFAGWVQIESGAGGTRMKIYEGYNDGANRWDFEYNEGGVNELSFNQWGASNNVEGTIALSEETWTFVTITIVPNGNVEIFVDATSDVTGTEANGTLDDGANFNIASRPDRSEVEWTGEIDEPRLSSTVRSDDWIQTRYNIEGNPGGFITVGAEQDTGVDIGAVLRSSSAVLDTDSSAVIQTQQ